MRELEARATLAQHQRDRMSRGLDAAHAALVQLVVALEGQSTQLEAHRSGAEAADLKAAVLAAIERHQAGAARLDAARERAQRQLALWVHRRAVAKQVKSSYLVSAASRRATEWTQVQAILLENQERNEALKQRLVALHARLIAPTEMT